MSKMLFVKSNDYWGYDASQFDDAVNFYRFTWVVPEAMYKTLDSDDQESLNPCALFYVQGVTDNHNFLTLKIAQDGDEAKVSGMQGTKRRTRRYNIGSPAQYSVGSYALQEAPAGATSIEAIKEAVESGSTSEGSFNVSEFLTEAADIAAAVNMVTEEKAAEASAETFAAPAEVPSGSAYEPADPTVANPATEGYSESELITMDEFSAMEYTPEIGGYPGLPVIPDSYGENSAGEGFGVPVWYGSAEDSEKVTEQDTEYWLGSDNTMNEAIEVITTVANGEYTPENLRQDILDIKEYYDAEGFEKYTFTFTVYDVNTGEKIDDGEVSVTATNEDSARYTAMQMLEEGGLDDEEFVLDAEGGRLRDIRGKFMNRRKAKDAVFGEVMSQQMSGYYRTGIVGDNPPVGQNIARRNPVAKARYFIEPGVQNPNSGEWSKGPNFQQARKIAKGVAWDTVQDMGLAAETAELQMTTLGDQEFPVVPDSYGESSAVVSGRGVPQWYGSAEQGYNDKMDESLGMRHRGSHKQSMKDRRDEASAMDKRHTRMGRKYDDVFTMDAEGDAPEEDYIITQVPLTEIDGVMQFGGVLFNPGREILRATAPKAGLYFDFYSDEWEDAGWANLPDMTDDEYEDCYFDFEDGGVFDGSDNMIVSLDDFANAIANYEITNTKGNHNWKKLPSRRKITETFEEAAPVSLKQPIMVAAISALTGFLIARRKS